MVAIIVFDLSNSTRIKLSERAEKVEVKQLNGVKYTNYQIVNIRIPEVRFSFSNEERDDISTFYYKITIRKEFEKTNKNY